MNVNYLFIHMERKCIGDLQDGVLTPHPFYDIEGRPAGRYLICPDIIFIH